MKPVVRYSPRPPDWIIEGKGVRVNVGGVVLWGRGDDIGVVVWLAFLGFLY